MSAAGGCTMEPRLPTLAAVRAIGNDSDYRAALARIAALRGAPAGTHEHDALELLTVLADLYEKGLARQ
jgi:antitoxin component HigA of HigAB toxin-antitoxin module